MKKCTKCNKTKHQKFFPVKNSSPDKLATACKLCAAEARLRYYKKNKQKLTKKSREYYFKNRNKILKNKKIYRQQNKHTIKLAHEKWVEKNYVHWKKQRANYQRKRRKEAYFRFAENIRTRTRQAFKVKSFTKSSGIAEILGCSSFELRSYIEKMFRPGMTWNNYGKWHVDHIKPIGKARSKAEVIKLSHYTNLQPLWAKDNFKKGAK